MLGSLPPKDACLVVVLHRESGPLNRLPDLDSDTKRNCGALRCRNDGEYLAPVPLPLARADLAQNRIDTRTETRELLIDDLPDEIKINTKIVMDEFVAGHRRGCASTFFETWITSCFAGPFNPRPAPFWTISLSPIARR